MAFPRLAGLFFTLIVATLVFTLPPAQAQVQPGIPTFSSIQDGPVDTVNLASGNILIRVPIRTKAAGTIPFSFLLSMNPSARSGGYPIKWTIKPQFTSALMFSGSVNKLSYPDTCDNGQNTTVYYGWTFTDANGTIHPFDITVDTHGCLYPKMVTGVATDGSGYTLVVNGAFSTLYDPAGNLVSPGASITDPNGNTITQTSSSPYVFTDSLGQTALTWTATNGSGSTDRYSYTDAAGTSRWIQVNYSQFTQQTVFGCTGISDISPTTAYFPTSVSLPDGSSLSLSYELTPNHAPNVTGRLAAITLPTGGTISYTYTGGIYGIWCSDGTVPQLTRTLTNTDGTSATWTYIHFTGSPLSTTTVIDAMGNETDYTFSNSIEVQRLQYTGNGGSRALLRTVSTCYNGNLTNCSTATVTSPITQKDTYTQFVGQSVSSLVETTYNSYGLLTQENQYFQNAPATLYRKNIIQYGSWNGSSCVAIGKYIVDRPCLVEATDGSNNIKSVRYFTYDSNGNLLTKSDSTASGLYLSTSYTYNTNGTIHTVTSPSGDVATFGYACNGQLVNYVSHSTGTLSTSSTSNCDGGVSTSITDENGHLTTYQYSTGVADPFWRVLTTIDQLQNSTTKSYSPTSFESSVLFNGNASVADQKGYLDSFGRAYIVQSLKTPGGSTWDTTTTYFDTIGRPTFNTFPCAASAGIACLKTGPGVTTTYDALGRVASRSDGHGDTITYTYTAATVGTNNPLDVLVVSRGKTTNNEYDALGRLTSVCEVSSLSGSGNCGQAVSKTGFITTYSYDLLNNLLSVTQGSQTRTFLYDQLSRPTSETNPESGQTQYFYDSAPSSPGVACPGTYNGSLVKKYDANGNTTCYQYDGLSRVTQITYPAGPNSASTPARFFSYDTQYQGVGTNLAGRLAAAGTCLTNTSCAGNPVVLEQFGYSVRGEPTDLWETTPHYGGTPYHTTVLYFANGAVNSLSGIPGQSAWTFGVDGKGRPKTATWGTTAEVTNTTYDAANRASVITLGLGDSDTYQYDSNTGHLNSYTFSVGSPAKTIVGTLNYSPTTGLPSSLGIVDGFNSTGSQTCTYGYDDMARVNNDGCGSWAQTFSYDRFGNVTKNGSIAWNPGYNNLNHYLGASTYDNNGNLTYDTFHHYTWNTQSKPVSIDSTTLIYDAFNNPVEKTASGTTTEILYSPLGKTALMNGQSVVKFFMPLPGGANFEYIAAGSYKLFHHKDGLGSSRFVSKGDLRTSYYDTAYAPFGEDYAGSGTSAELNFTGQRQDIVSGTYDFSAREYHPRQGRWITPDPAGMRAANPSNPQSWNRYAYVENNPLNATDPLGLCKGDPGQACEGHWQVLDALGYGGTCFADPNCATYYVNGIQVSGIIAMALLSSGAAFGCQCDTNARPDSNGTTWDLFQASADGSAGFVPMSLPGASALDIANALALVTSAAPKLGKPIDPASLTGKGADAFRLLTEMGVAAGDITIYQNDGGDFYAVLSDQGYQTLLDSGKIQFHPGDAFLHYPYTNGARDRNATDSLHGVWFDSRVTDYVGGSGVYMQFHTDKDNPWSGSMWGHLMCSLFKAGC